MGTVVVETSKAPATKPEQKITDGIRKRMENAPIAINLRHDQYMQEIIKRLLDIIDIQEDRISILEGRKEQMEG